MARKGFHTLRLCFTPFSNQEGEWFWEDAEMRKILSASKLYMIGHRKEVRFDAVKVDEAEGLICLALTDGMTRIDGIRLPLAQFEFEKDARLMIAGGPKIIRFFNKSGSEPDLFHWFTPDRLLYYYWRNELEAEGLSGFRKFTSFDLYYVGISKKGDSFSRLFKTAHEKRSRILGNEAQINPTARLTDEITLFLFEIDRLDIFSILPDDDDQSLELGAEPPNALQIVADAEKAFVQILRSKYNSQQYAAYPKSNDGLWSANYEGYTFTIDECITLRTSDAEMRFSRVLNAERSDKAGDMISIRGETVRLIKL